MDPVFKDLTDGFVGWIRRFAQQQQIPILRVTGRTRPGEVAHLKAAERSGRWGVVLDRVLKHHIADIKTLTNHSGFKWAA